MTSLRIGIHTSRSGCLENAAAKARELGADTFQIFSASPRMWRADDPIAEDVRRLRLARRQFDLWPLVIHANYLCNLATLDPVIRAKSIVSFQGELRRAVQIGAEYLVIHPGSYRTCSADQGITGFVHGLQEASIGMKTGELTVLIENTVGAGAQLGSRFSELRAIRELATRSCGVPVGYCLDTCHLFAAGFDLSTASGFETMVAEAESELGMDHVKVIHCNDSKGGVGSRLDRHANIGEGRIGEKGFRRILNHPALRSKPFILETPVDVEGDDRRNLETLQRLSRPVGAAKTGENDRARNKRAKTEIK